MVRHRSVLLGRAPLCILRRGHGRAERFGLAFRRRGGASSGMAQGGTPSGAASPGGGREDADDACGWLMGDRIEQSNVDSLHQVADDASFRMSAKSPSMDRHSLCARRPSWPKPRAGRRPLLSVAKDDNQKTGGALRNNPRGVACLRAAYVAGMSVAGHGGPATQVPPILMVTTRFQTMSGDPFSPHTHMQTGGHMLRPSLSGTGGPNRLGRSCYPSWSAARTSRQKASPRRLCRRVGRRHGWHKPAHDPRTYPCGRNMGTIWARTFSPTSTRSMSTSTFFRLS